MHDYVWVVSNFLLWTLLPNKKKSTMQIDHVNLVSNSCTSPSLLAHFHKPDGRGFGLIHLAKHK